MGLSQIIPGLVRLGNTLFLADADPVDLHVIPLGVYLFLPENQIYLLLQVRAVLPLLLLLLDNLIIPLNLLIVREGPEQPTFSRRMELCSFWSINSLGGLF